MSEPVQQLTEAELKAMPPEKVVEAHRAGQLDALMGKIPAEPVPPERAAAEESEGRITVADLATMTPEQIVEARQAGQLEHLGYAGNLR